VFDASWTFVDVELIPGQKEGFNLSAGFIGLGYCFRVLPTPERTGPPARDQNCPRPGSSKP
jgi:hypothetical protein